MPPVPWQDPVFRRWALLGTTLSLLVAWLTPGFLHPDEHFQVLEFAHYLRGGTPASDLAWEFRSQIRPFLQPAIYAGIITPLAALGLESPHAWVRILRISTTLIGLYAAWTLARQYPRWLKTQAGLHFAWAATALLYFLPFVRARTSSESAASAAMLGIFALLAGAPRAPGEARSSLPPQAAFWAFFLAGVAFQLRYQMALMFLGVGLWCLLIARISARAWAAAVAGFLSATLLGVFSDRLGYGEWILPPVRYFAVNLLEGKAAEFGTRPTEAYVGLLWHDLGKPFGALVLLVFVGLLLRRPKDLLVWSALPFILLHAIIAHKETRFLSPCYFLVPVAAAILYEELAQRWPGRGWRASAVVLAALNGFYLLTAHGFFLSGGGLREALGAEPIGPVYYVGDHPFGGEQPRMDLYWPKTQTVEPLPVEAIEARLALEPQLYFAYHGRHVPPPPFPAACTELFREPHLYPEAWYENRAIRRLFDVRDFRRLYRCQATSAYAAAP